MELSVKGEKEPWHIPNDDRSEINLEHVLPEKPGENWPEFSDDEVRLYYKRIGNLCLLRASDNSTAKSSNFLTKKQIYQKSPYKLTKQIANASSWITTEITSRQKMLAKIAVETWMI